MAPSDANPPGADGGANRQRTRKRSLRAVFAADVAGFSGRMSLNETLTVTAISEILALGRQELDRHHGWLFGMPGDGLFATFESGINAVECALAFQAALTERPTLSDLPVRIGIHLGEVLIDNNIPYGETLNIAARLESLADPGGILVSGTVMDAVASRISATFEDRGVPQLKNIPRRIPTFAVKRLPVPSASDDSNIDEQSLDRTTRVDRDALRDVVENRAHEVWTRSSQAPNAPAPAAPGPLTAPLSGANEEHLPLDQLARIGAAVSQAHSPEPQPGDVPMVPNSQETTDQTSDAPSSEVIAAITQALAVHVGPLAKLMVEQQLSRTGDVLDIITGLEQLIPSGDERKMFRQSVANLSGGGPNDDDGAPRG